MMKSGVKLPDKVIRIEKGQPDTVDAWPIHRKAMIVYCAPEECSNCRLNKIMEYEPLFIQSQKSDFTLFLLFTPEEASVNQVIERICSMNLTLPVFVDYQGYMSSTSVPADVRFHTFLLDSLGNVLFVGNPLQDEVLNELFNKHVSQLPESQTDAESYKYKAVFETQASIIPSDVEDFLLAGTFSRDSDVDLIMLVPPYPCRECLDEQCELVFNFFNTHPLTSIKILAPENDQLELQHYFVSLPNVKLSGYELDRRASDTQNQELLNSVLFFTFQNDHVASLYIANRLFPDITLTFFDKIVKAR